MKLIVCCDANYGIGKDGGIPWHCPEDMKHFSDTTRGHTVVMGRKTAESIPSGYFPLENRLNVIVTSTPSFARGVVEIANPDYIKYIHQKGKLFCIGGASLYEYFLACGQVDEIIMTLLDKEYGCDTFFPSHYLDDFKFSSSECGVCSETGTSFFIDYLKRKV